MIWVLTSIECFMERQGCGPVLHDLYGIGLSHVGDGLRRTVNSVWLVG